MISFIFGMPRSERDRPGAYVTGLRSITQTLSEVGEIAWKTEALSIQENRLVSERGSANLPLNYAPPKPFEMLGVRLVSHPTLAESCRSVLKPGRRKADVAM
jgi:hypothetical protein